MQFKEQGYLFLASAQGEATLRRNQATQAAQGVSWTRLLSPEALQRRFPWLNVDGVALLLRNRPATDLRRLLIGGAPSGVPPMSEREVSLLQSILEKSTEPPEPPLSLAHT